MKLRLSRRQLALTVAIGLVVSGVTVLTGAIFNTHTAPPISTSDGPPPVVANQLPEIPTDLDQLEKALGPFQTITVASDTPTPDTQYPAVLELVHDGSTKASEQWKIPFSTTRWTENEAFMIQSLSHGGGYATFTISQNRQYTVRCGQPFFFEDAPQQVYVIDAQGTQWSMINTRAIAARQAK